MTINAARKRAKEENDVDLSFRVTRNLVRDSQRTPRVEPSVQTTLTGKNASARSAKHPAVELYDRLGLQHCLPADMRTKFLQASVYALKKRRRRTLVRVGTPLVEVGHLLTHSNASPYTHTPNLVCRKSCRA